MIWGLSQVLHFPSVSWPPGRITFLFCHPEFNVSSFCRTVGPTSYSRMKILRLDGNKLEYHKLPPDWVFCLRVLHNIYIWSNKSSHRLEQLYIFMPLKGFKIACNNILYCNIICIFSLHWKAWQQNKLLSIQGANVLNKHVVNGPYNFFIWFYSGCTVYGQPYFVLMYSASLVPCPSFHFKCSKDLMRTSLTVKHVKTFKSLGSGSFLFFFLNTFI